MMKGLEKIGKVMGLLLVATALLFAGCMSDGGGSSSDNAVPADSQTSGTAIPMTFDSETRTLTVGDGEGTKSAVINGHTIGLVNGFFCSTYSGSTCTAWTEGCQAYGGGGECGVDLVNMDSDEYMANAFIEIISCPLCTDATFDSADARDGVTCAVIGNGDPQCSEDLASTSDLDRVQICVVEDGQYGSGQPWNKMGCATQQANPAAVSEHKPVQIIGPGSSKSSVWKLSADSGPASYQFFAWVTADYFPYDNIITSATTSSDPRYDMQDQGTFYVTVNALTDDGPVSGEVNKAWYEIGSYKRSRTLSGYGATGSNKMTPLPKDQKYFAVNVALEYPNRIEDYKMGDKVGGDVNYEYYTQYSFLLRYDPKVVEPIFGIFGMGMTMTPAFTTISAGMMEICTLGNCGKGKETFRQYTAPGANGSGGYGIISTFESMSNAASAELFTAFGANTYSTVGGLVINHHGFGEGHGCAGHHGVAHFDMSKDCGMFTVDPNCVIHEGPDIEPEMPLALTFFKLYSNPMGTGSEFWIDMYSGYTSFTMGWTNGTLLPSGASEVTDLVSYCFDPDGANTAEQPCPPDTDTTIVTVGQQRPNPAIRQEGPFTVPYDPVYPGAFQQWPASIVVQ